jgi:hypothetical protein
MNNMDNLPPIVEMPDEHKLQLIREIIQTMAPEFKDALIAELDPVRGETETLEMHVTSNGQVVRVDLSKRVRWFALPSEHTIQFAMLLLEHAGAKIARE